MQIKHQTLFSWTLASFAIALYDKVFTSKKTWHVCEDLPIKDISRSFAENFEF